jgi:hypothetical protein
MENATADILTMDIHELSVSRALVTLLELNQLNNLNALLDYPMEEWFSFTGFNQHLLNELLNYLASTNLLSLVKN